MSAQGHKTDAPSHDDRPAVHKSNLEDFEREADVRLPFLLSYREVKLLGIAGVRAHFPVPSHTTASHPPHFPPYRLDSSSMVREGSL